MYEKCADCFNSMGGGPRYGNERCRECLREQDREVREQRRADRFERPDRAVTKSPRGKSTMLFYHGKKVGVVSGNTFTTYRKRDAHFCRKHGGWGLNTDVFRELKDAQVAEIIVVADGATLRVSVEDWERYGVIDTLSAEDGEQTFLSEDHFREK